MCISLSLHVFSDHLDFSIIQEECLSLKFSPRILWFLLVVWGAVKTHVLSWLMSSPLSLQCKNLSNPLKDYTYLKETQKAILGVHVFNTPGEAITPSLFLRINQLWEEMIWQNEMSFLRIQFYTHQWPATKVYLPKKWNNRILLSE